MLQPGVIQSLALTLEPVLTVYLDTDQAKQVNRGPKPGYLVRLGSQAKLIAQAISPDEQELFGKQLQRLESTADWMGGPVLKTRWSCLLISSCRVLTGVRKIPPTW